MLYKLTKQNVYVCVYFEVFKFLNFKVILCPHDIAENNTRVFSSMPHCIAFSVLLNGYLQLFKYINTCWLRAEVLSWLGSIFISRGCRYRKHGVRRRERWEEEMWVLVNRDQIDGWLSGELLSFCLYLVRIRLSFGGILSNFHHYPKQLLSPWIVIILKKSFGFVPWENMNASVNL